MNLKKVTFEFVGKQSTCQKRVTVCAIFDIDGYLLSIESNRCNPDGGVCHRLGLVQDKSNYDINSNCNWIHAEIMAINTLPKDCKPYKSVLYGHDFYCDRCEQALKDVGVIKFEIWEN